MAIFPQVQWQEINHVFPCNAFATGKGGWGVWDIDKKWYKMQLSGVCIFSLGLRDKAAVWWILSDVSFVERDLKQQWHHKLVSVSADLVSSVIAPLISFRLLYPLLETTPSTAPVNGLHGLFPFHKVSCTIYSKLTLTTDFCLNVVKRFRSWDILRVLL